MSNQIKSNIYSIRFDTKDEALIGLDWIGLDWTILFDARENIGDSNGLGAAAGACRAVHPFIYLGTSSMYSTYVVMCSIQVNLC